MNIQTYIDCLLLSGKLDNMIIERFLLKKLKLGDKIRYQQLEKTGNLQIRKYCEHLNKFSSDICSLDNCLNATSNVNIL